jgi:hypothetical protein
VSPEPFHCTVDADTKLVPVTVSVKAAPPAVALEGESALSAGTGLLPVPVRLTVCGLLLALSVIVRVPVRVPPARGVKVTLIVQLALGVSELGHALVWAKSPLTLMMREVNAALPLLLRVTVCGGLVVETVCPAKVRLVVERLTTGASPVPLRVTFWGLLLALSVSASVPLRAPLAVGVKVTLMVQLAPGDSEIGQELVWAKSPLTLKVRGVNAP